MHCFINIHCTLAYNNSIMPLPLLRVSYLPCRALQLCGGCSADEQAAQPAGSDHKEAAAAA
jgi:hypothetical protein